MSKFTKATKRIAAVAASAVMVSSAAFGAGLSSYPQNFVSSGKFDGKVVVGSAASAMDTTSATSIIEDLKSEFSGSSSKTKITYKSASAGGEEISAVRSNQALNYNETIGAVTETAGFDDQDVDVLADGRFKNGISDEDYEQKLVLSNGDFNYALRDEVAGITEIKDGVFFGDQEVFATYTLDLKTAISNGGVLTSNEADEFIGNELSIMGNEFTIGDITFSQNNVSKLVLLGGANKVSLGEGESTSVTIDGKVYEVSVQSVSSTKVLLTINGESKSIDEFDSEDIAGVSVAVTDLVSSSRDAVKGYAEIVIGGQKITLEDGTQEVKINEDDISDLYEDYEVTSDFTGSGIDAVVITYKVGDDILLEKGDSLNDVLFQTFALTFDGTNEPEYSEIKLTVDDDDIKVAGITEDNVDLSMNLLHMGDKTNSATAVWLKGENDEDRIIYADSKNLTGKVVGGLTTAFVDGTIAVFNLNDTAVKGSGFLLEKDNNEQYLYTVSSIDTVAAGTHEVDFEEYLRADDEADIQRTEWESKLGVVLGATTFTEAAESNTVNTIANLGDVIAYENEVLLDLSSAEDDDMSGGSASSLVFSLDTDDTDADGTEDAQTVTVTLGYDATDDEFDISSITSSVGFANAGDEDNKKSNSDVKTYVNGYGVKVEYDNDEKQSATIMVPEEQVAAEVTLSFGGTAASSMSVTVDSSAAADKKAELEEDGYTVVSSEAVSTTAVTFGVTAPAYDADVSGMDDMIVVGGPAVNKVAAALLGLSYPTYGAASGVGADEAVIRYFADSNSVVVYGYEGKDTAAAVSKLNAGGLSGEVVNV